MVHAYGILATHLESARREQNQRYQDPDFIELLITLLKELEQRRIKLLEEGSPDSQLLRQISDIPKVIGEPIPKKSRLAALGAYLALW